MRISDWSSDVCSSDLKRWTAEFFATNLFNTVQVGNLFRGIGFTDVAGGGGPEITSYKPPRMYGVRADRKSVVEGTGVSVRVDTGGRTISQKTNVITTKRQFSTSRFHNNLHLQLSL